jgi:hypothetical protein
MADLRCLPGEHYHALPLLVMLTAYGSYFLWVWQALMPFCGLWGGSISGKNFFHKAVPAIIRFL